jgi:hypothetical protein
MEQHSVAKELLWGLGQNGYIFDDYHHSYRRGNLKSYNGYIFLRKIRKVS